MGFFKKKKGMEEFCDGLDVSKLSLSSLPMPEFSREAMRRIEERQEREIKWLKLEYGDKWFNKYVELLSGGFSLMMKCANVSIYNGHLVHGIGDSDFDGELEKTYDARAHELYGDRYDELVCHEVGDPEISKLLVEDAVKGEKWGELPDELYQAYHEIIPEYDETMQFINGNIYDRGSHYMTGTPEAISRILSAREARMRELYGDRYDELSHCMPRDERVKECLIADALKTGKWMELPDELRDEYFRRAGGSDA